MPIPARSAFTIGLSALTANPMRTALSTLGVVMGVGAMVSVLSMGDGMAKFAQQQIEETTDLLGVSVSPITFTNIDGQLVRRSDIVHLSSTDAYALAGAVRNETTMALMAVGTALVRTDSTSAPRGFSVMGTLQTHFVNTHQSIIAGRVYADSDTAVVVLNRAAAGVISGDSTRPADAIGKIVTLNGGSHTVIGVVDGGKQRSAQLVAFVPVADIARALPASNNPAVTLLAERIEQVDSVRSDAERWALATYGANWKERIAVRTNQARVDQVNTGMRLFKLLMGAITGVSLLVGGVGIMNVLLAAVAERTREIGVRKATGARHRDIMLQFLAESVAITGFGGFLGVLLGLSVAFGVAAIMRARTQAEVFAAIEPTTILIAAALSVAIGLVFGLYPAMRAARLSPIDAIRHD